MMRSRTKNTARSAACRSLASSGAVLLLTLAACSGESSEESVDTPDAIPASTNAPGETGSEKAGTTAAASTTTPEGDPADGTETPEKPSAGAGESAPGPAGAGESAPDPAGAGDGTIPGPAPVAKGEDPCADVTPEDLAEAVGIPVRERMTEGPSDVRKQLEVSDGDWVQCSYPADGQHVSLVSVQWVRIEMDYPDAMPEELQTKEQRRVYASYAEHQEGAEPVAVADVPGAHGAVHSMSMFNSTFVNVHVPFEDAALTVTLAGDLGTLDESDIPRAVKVAEVAIGSS